MVLAVLLPLVVLPVPVWEGAGAVTVVAGSRGGHRVMLGTLAVSLQNKAPPPPPTAAFALKLTLARLVCKHAVLPVERQYMEEAARYMPPPKVAELPERAQRGMRERR